MERIDEKEKLQMWDHFSMLNEHQESEEGIQLSKHYQESNNNNNPPKKP